MANPMLVPCHHTRRDRVTTVIAHSLNKGSQPGEFMQELPKPRATLGEFFLCNKSDILEGALGFGSSDSSQLSRRS